MLQKRVSAFLVAFLVLSTVFTFPENAIARSDRPGQFAGDKTEHRIQSSTSAAPLVPVLSPSVVPRYSFHDTFDYANISAMVAAGWSMCGNGPSSYYSVSGGILTLYWDSDNGTAAHMCWSNIPGGISSWSVTTRDEWLTTPYNSFVGGLSIAVSTTTHYYQWADDFDSSSYVLSRDGQQVFSLKTSRVPGDQWHDLGLEMRNGRLSMLYDDLVIGTYVESDFNANLTRAQLLSTWGDYNAFDHITISQIDPNAPDFTLIAGPASQNIAVGSNASLTVSLASMNSFSGPVNLATMVTPSGPNSLTVTPSLSVVSLSVGEFANSNLTISTQSVISASTFNIRINATSGSLFHSVEVTASVTGPTQGQTFSFVVNPSSLILRQSGTGAWTTQNITVTLSGVSGFTGTVALSADASNPAPGPVALIDPSQIRIEGNKTFTATVYFTQGGSGTWYVTITATTAGISQTTSVTVDFVPSYFYTGMTPSGNLIVPVGSSSSVSLNLVSQNGYAGTVSLSYWSIYALPANPPTVSFSTSPVTLIPNATTTIQVIVSANPATPTGSYGFIIRAKGGWWTEDTQINVYVADHQVSPGVSAGTTATYNVTLSSLPRDIISVVVTVTEVSGSTVYFTQALYVDKVFTNTTAGSIDVADGTQKGTIYIPFPFVSAGLRVGDQLFSAATYGSIDISSASTNALAGMSRSTITGGTGLNIYLLPVQFTATWDEPTGILGILDGTVPINSTDVTAHYRLESTNAWNSLRVELSSPIQAEQFSTITFVSHVSGGTQPYSYDWNFGDGQTSTDANPVHRYLMPGNYTVTLRVTDSGGIVRSQTSMVRVTGFTIPSSFPTSLLPSSFFIPALIGLAVYMSIALSASYLLIRRDRGKQRRLAQKSVNPSGAHAVNFFEERS